MRKTELEHIRSVVERVRQDLHPDLDRTFVDTILEIKSRSSDDDANAIREIRTALDTFLRDG